MNGRQRATSVPTEILRSVIAIAETGSISKAAKLLGISQPAISTQIKRIEDLVGGAIFTKSADGSTVTHLGDLVLVQAKKVLEANHQILLLRGTRNDKRGLRLGIGDLHAETSLAALKPVRLDDVSIVVNCSMEIMKGLLNGYIDLGLVTLVPNIAIDSSIEVMAEGAVEMAWVRAPNFTLSPGAPVPLLTWGGQVAHQLMVTALERQGLIYRIAFSSPNPQLRIEAASRGLGLTALPRSEIPASLVEAKDYYLPPLPTAKMFLCRRIGSEADRNKVFSILKDHFFESGQTHAHKCI